MFIGHNTDKLQNEYVLHQQTCNYTVQTYGLAVTWAFHCPLVRVALLANTEPDWTVRLSESIDGLPVEHRYVIAVTIYVYNDVD